MDAISSKPILQGEYKLLKVLQKLPYSTYYLGTSIHKPEDRWAIKEIILNFATAQEQDKAFRRFEENAEKYTRLEHSILVPLTDYFDEHGFVYVIFPFIPGHRLGEIFELRKKPFSEEQVLDFAFQVGSAINYLHERNIVYHDLNPSNIIITPEGSIKLTDYGLGKMLTRWPEDLPLWGTLGYSPPEQYGSKAELKPGIDVFALGMVMAQMLTLEDPVKAKGVYQSVKKSNPDISEDMDILIYNATLPDPSQRYASMQEFLDDVSKLVTIKLQPAQKKEEEGWLQKLTRELSRPFNKK